MSDEEDWSTYKDADILENSDGTTFVPAPVDLPTPIKPIIRTLATYRIQIGQLGWTQNTISPKVFNITINNSRPFRSEVGRALEIENVTERLEYFGRRFEPMVVYYDEQYGYLSTDNRRLAIYRLTLPPDTLVPVHVLTRLQAGQLIAERGGAEDVGVDLAEETIAERYSSPNGGYSINITFPKRDGGRLTLTRDDTVQSPYMDLTVELPLKDELPPKDEL